MSDSIVLRWVKSRLKASLLAQCLAACGVLAILTYIGFTFRFNLTTISFLYLLLIIGIALFYGFWEASLMSLLAVACLDYFFTQPLFHFYMTDPQDVVALGAFEVTTIVISRLSAKELRSAREAAVHRAGMEQLYELSRNSLLLDMRQAPGPQLAVLIQQIFGVHAVALFDLNLGRQDRAGEWDEGEENLAKQCYLSNHSFDDKQSHTSQRILRAGDVSVGALAIRGELDSLVVDALASLAAIMIDRHQGFEKEERAETANKSEQLRAAVLDALAHELKTPLTAVQTASSGLLELGGLSDLQRDLVTLINVETSRLNQLCTRLLMTAKLEADKVGLQMDEVNVKELVTEVLASDSVKAGKNRIRIELEDPELTLRVDRQLLAMVLTQYLNNALKYSTPETPIGVFARISHTEAILSVHNFGPAIRVEDRERVFDRFYRAPGMKETVPGTGIGLSVVRKAAEAHHGHVWVISDDREGTTFFFSLPISARRKQ
jgi:two-component system sensor histidine kinase KdpD